MDTFKAAINTFGISMQEDIAIEEMAELTKEIIKKRRGKNNEEAIKEEIADVLIMMVQLAEYYGMDDVESWMDKKETRLAERILNHNKEIKNDQAN